jgi:hypothetical protein
LGRFIRPYALGPIHPALFIRQNLDADHPARGVPEGQTEGVPGQGTEVVEELAQVGGAAAAFDVETFAETAEALPTRVELGHRLLDLGGLVDDIGGQAQAVDAQGFFEGLFEIEGAVFDRLDLDRGFEVAGEVAGRGRHLFDGIDVGGFFDFGMDRLLVGFGELFHLADEGGEVARWQVVTGGALPDNIGQQVGGDGGPFVGDLLDLLAIDPFAILGDIADQLLDFGACFGGFDEGALAELIEILGFEVALFHHRFGAVGQFDQVVGAGFGDFAVLEPVEKARAPAITFVLFAIAHRSQNPPAPDLGLDIKPIADLPSPIDLLIKMQIEHVAILRVGKRNGEPQFFVEEISQIERGSNHRTMTK